MNAITESPGEQRAREARDDARAERSTRTPGQGLTAAEAAAAQARDGFNELPGSKPRGAVAIVCEVVREPMFLLLLACGGLYLALGDPAEAAMLLGFVFVVMGITFVQERRTERALDALRDLSSPRAMVIRDGVAARIAARELVQGDLIRIVEGDRVPADAVAIESTSLTVDESLLTGESVPVRKAHWDGFTEASAPGGDDLPFLYSSTLVVKGEGVAQVTATGIRTEVGKIGRALQTLAPEPTTLQRQTRRIVRDFSIVGLALCVIVVVVFGLTRGSWTEGLLAGVTLAMATLPEEFPVVLTIFLALGAWRMSSRHVLTRRIPAVETLGATTVLCVDKTGTLTLNQMHVSAMLAGDELMAVDEGTTVLPDHFHLLAEYGALAGSNDPVDPMEKAVRQICRRFLSGDDHGHAGWEMLREYPLSDRLLAMARVWRPAGGQDCIVAAKGAPEAIAGLCRLTPAQTAAITAHVEAMAGQGLRVIAVASARIVGASLPDEQQGFPFQLVGLLGLSDPVRPEVPAAVETCRQAGVRVIMITGDYPKTASSIARQIGLTAPDDVITGPELNGMDDAALQTRIRKVNVFARVVPEQKLRIVNAVKANGDVVAMTGDGVNDAPALKAAHIGVAMGGRGTDVAREAASIVLLDDNFTSIVHGVRMGRRIFDNLKKAMSFIVSVHVPIAGMSLIPVLLNWPLALMPIHVVLLELIIDPACSTVFEAQSEEAGTMRRPARQLEAPLFDRATMLRSVLQGLVALAMVWGVFATVWLTSGSAGEARAAGFTTLVIANLGLILSNRARSEPFFRALRQPNPALWWVLSGATAFLVATLSAPALRRFCEFAPLHALDLGLALGAGLLSLVLVDQVKARRPAPMAA